MMIIGIDPGLRHTGWGIIESHGNRLAHVAHGVISPQTDEEMAERLVVIFDGLSAVMEEFTPDSAAVESTFVNKNAASTLKLGQARAIALLVPARSGIKVSEYAPNLVKKALTGSGHAGKEQIAVMVGHLLPGANPQKADAADALAIAICHAHHVGSAANRVRLKQVVGGGQ